MTHHSWGDSLTVGVNASPIGTNSYIHLLEAALPATITNHAVSASQAGNQGTVIESYATSGTDTHLLMLGTNDFRMYKADTTKRSFFERAWMQVVTNLALPSKAVRGSGLTFTGTWTNGGSGWNRTTQLGAKVTATVSGSTIYVGSTIQNSGTPNGTANIKVDGTVVGTINSNGVGCMTFLGIDYFPTAYRISGLSAGTHTVEIECTSSGQYLYLDWIAGSAQAAIPKLYVATLPKMSASRYTTDGTSDTLLQSYNSFITGAVADLKADGLDITLVDGYGAIDPATGLDPDGIHFNNAGHAQMKEAWMTAINGVPVDPPSEPVVTTFGMAAGQTLTVTTLDDIVTNISIE